MMGLLIKNVTIVTMDEDRNIIDEEKILYDCNKMCKMFI